MIKVSPRKLTQHFKRQSHKILKHTQTIRRQQPKKCLSMFDHFVELALKGLILVHRLNLN